MTSACYIQKNKFCHALESSFTHQQIHVKIWPIWQYKLCSTTKVTILGLNQITVLTPPNILYNLGFLMLKCEVYEFFYKLYSPKSFINHVWIWFWKKLNCSDQLSLDFSLESFFSSEKDSEFWISLRPLQETENFVHGWSVCHIQAGCSN